MAERWVSHAMPRSGQRATDHAARMKVRERYEAGETCEEIAPDFGISSHTVRRTLRDMGVELRPAARRYGRPLTKRAES